MFDIDGFEPEWLQGAGRIGATHGSRLNDLEGRCLSAVWLVWDSTDDTWFADGPIVLDFEGERVEICHSKFADLSITWNRIDLSSPIRWEFDGTFPLAWRHDTLPSVEPLVGSRLLQASLQEWRGRDVAAGMVSVGFEFPRGRLLVSNGLDENQLEFGPFGSNFRTVTDRRDR